jgi:hypothetical protein
MFPEPQAVTSPSSQGEGAVASSVRQDGANVFVVRFKLPSDASLQVVVHVRAYNVYRPSVWPDRLRPANGVGGEGAGAVGGSEQEAPA